MRDFIRFGTHFWSTHCWVHSKFCTAYCLGSLLIEPDPGRPFCDLDPVPNPSFSLPKSNLIQIWQCCKKVKTLCLEIAVYWFLDLHVKLPSYKQKPPALQRDIFFMGHFCLPDQVTDFNPDPDQQTQLNPDPIRIRIGITDFFCCCSHCRTHPYVAAPER